jgi:general stress protein YciG
MQNNSKNRGFAAMDSSRQREIARKGGKAAHQKGTAHEFTADEARAAGRKGGETVSANRGHMSHIGRIGGKKSAGRKKQGSQAPPALPTDDARNPQRGEMETHIAESSENHPAEDAA